jgi:hypothetical protein
MDAMIIFSSLTLARSPLKKCVWFLAMSEEEKKKKLVIARKITCLRLQKADDDDSLRIDASLSSLIARLLLKISSISQNTIIHPSI